MPVYVLPTFNLDVNLWHNGNTPPAPPDTITVGNLTPGRRTIGKYATETGGAELPANMFLLVPLGTDIRDAKGGTGDDLAEVPAGSGRFYTVRFVDDIGFGFSNEHRFAILSGLGPWPIPFPAGDGAVNIVGGSDCFTSVPIKQPTTYRCTIPPLTSYYFYLSPLLPAPPIALLFTATFLSSTLAVTWYQGDCTTGIVVLNTAAGATPPLMCGTTTSALLANFELLQLENGSALAPLIVEWNATW